MARITTIPLFNNQSLSAGDSVTSEVIDLRYNTNQRIFSLASRVVAGTAGTCGTTVFTYKGCHIPNGNFISPVAAIAIGTAGTAATADIAAFTPMLMPFMKIIATQTGADTAGKDSKVSAELILQ